jgi:NarL family two-component system sensor histidine kinase LiaS
VIVDVIDNGHGFDESRRRSGHYGLQSMRSRAAEVGASLTIMSRAGRGTIVRMAVRAPAGGTVDGA